MPDRVAPRLAQLEGTFCAEAGERVFGDDLPRALLVVEREREVDVSDAALRHDVAAEVEAALARRRHEPYVEDMRTDRRAGGFEADANRKNRAGLCLAVCPMRQMREALPAGHPHTGET